MEAAHYRDLHGAGIRFFNREASIAMISDSEHDPIVIFSNKSRAVSLHGVTVDVYIYRLPSTKWTLEILDADGFSTILDEQFRTDDDAYVAFERIMAGEMQKFMPTVSHYLH